MLSPCHPEIGTNATVFGFSAVHLVDTTDELLDSKSVGEKSVFTGLSVLRDTSFKFTNTSSYNEHSTISLGGTSDHVLDEISVSRSINDGNIVL